jgi:hypothetical protein
MLFGCIVATGYDAHVIAFVLDYQRYWERRT